MNESTVVSLETIVTIAGASVGAFSAFACCHCFSLITKVVEGGGSPEAIRLVRQFMVLCGTLGLALIAASAFLGFNNRHFASLARANAESAERQLAVAKSNLADLGAEKAGLLSRVAEVSDRLDGVEKVLSACPSVRNDVVVAELERLSRQLSEIAEPAVVMP